MELDHIIITVRSSSVRSVPLWFDFVNRQGFIIKLRLLPHSIQAFHYPLDGSEEPSRKSHREKL